VAAEAAPFGVDLQVFGHTRSGQMAPFNLLVNLRQPMVSGFGRVDGVPVFVTDGARFWSAGPAWRAAAGHGRRAAVAIGTSRSVSSFARGDS